MEQCIPAKARRAVAPQRARSVASRHRGLQAETVRQVREENQAYGRFFFFFLVYSCFFVFFDFGNPRPFARDSFIFRMLDDLRLWLLPQGGLVLLRGRNLLRGHGV